MEAVRVSSRSPSPRTVAMHHLRYTSLTIGPTLVPEIDVPINHINQMNFSAKACFSYNFDWISYNILIVNFWSRLSFPFDIFSSCFFPTEENVR